MHLTKPWLPHTIMPRSESFPPDEEPFRNNDNLKIDHSATHGPVSSFAPTQATFSYSSDGKARPSHSYGTIPTRQSEANTSGDVNPQQIHGSHQRSNVEYRWTSRNSRKGRHTLLVGERSLAHDTDYSTPAPTNGLIPTLKGIWRMVSCFPSGDFSFLTAVSFVTGCTLLVVNAFLSLLPRLNTDIQLSPKTTIIQAWLTFLGCTLFLISSSMSYLEAVNASKDGCFGWSAEQTAPESSGNNEGLGIGETTRLVPDEQCNDHYNQESNRGSKQQDAPDCSDERGETSFGRKRRGMRMLPSLHELRTSYLYDLGFIACATLFISSIVYWLTALASLVVTIIGSETAPWIRVLQLIAAIGFAAASAIFMIETQDHWTVPALHVLGWHVGFWNLVGSCGFALFAVFALDVDEQRQSHSVTHYFWGMFRLWSCIDAKADVPQGLGGFSLGLRFSGTSRLTSIRWSGNSDARWTAQLSEFDAMKCLQLCIYSRRTSVFARRTLPCLVDAFASA